MGGWSRGLFVGVGLLALLLAGCGDALPDMTDGVTTDSGLKYQDLKVGDGLAVQPRDSRHIRYTAWMKATGEQLARVEEPAMVHQGALFYAGLDEGVLGMRVGGKRRMYLPPALGAGKGGDFIKIPANSTLVFDVELVRILP